MPSPEDYGLVVHQINQEFAGSAARRTQGSDFIAEVARLGHLEQVRTIDAQESVGLKNAAVSPTDTKNT